MMSSKLMIAFLVVAGASICLGQTKNYCSVKSCGTSPNTLCKFQTSSWGSACEPADKGASVVSAADITTILKAHNDYRRNVAKGLEKRGGAMPGTNIRQLAWDNELAKMAQVHAQQCKGGHDQCRNVDRFRVGQNVYMAMSTAAFKKSDWNTAIKAWYEEVQYMTASNHKQFGKPTAKPVGHYTQVLWARTYLVGCGMATFKSSIGLPFNQIYVCNYGEAGNFVDEPVYIAGAVGSAGSACPAGTKNNDGLCA